VAAVESGDCDDGMTTTPTRKRGGTHAISWRSSSADFGKVFREEEGNKEDDVDEQGRRA
jgi:hypothetical protein